MGRSFSATTGKNVVWAGLDGLVRAEFQRTAGLNALVQVEFLKTTGLSGDVSLYAVYEMSAGLNSYVTPPSTLLNGLLGYWKLDGDSTDAIPSGHNGADTAITYSVGNGKINQGAGFNGSTSVIIMTAGIALDSNNWSIACWHKPSTVGGFDRFLSYYGSGPTLQRNGTQIRLVHASTVDFTPTGFTVSAGVWSHIVFTRSGTTFAAYKNGTLVQSVTASATYTADTSVRLGNSSAFNEPLNGALDEVALYNRALTAPEVTELYNSGGGLQYPFSGTPS